MIPGRAADRLAEVWVIKSRIFWRHVSCTASDLLQLLILARFSGLITFHRLSLVLSLEVPRVRHIVLDV